MQAQLRRFVRPLLLSAVLLVGACAKEQPSLVADVGRILTTTGLPAHCLKLEITESVIIRDVFAAVPVLRKLKDLGIQLAIDDFGTGYASLSYLKRLPVDALKIDRSFIQGIGQDQEDTAIVQATMMLAKSLHLKVTGEGIETAEQAAILAGWGCDLGQGYLYSRPLNAEAAGQFLATAGPSGLSATAGADEAALAP